MKLTLQVSSRTESFNLNDEPVYHLQVQLQSNGGSVRMSELVTLQVTKEEFDAMPPGHVFVGELRRPDL